MMPSPTPPPVRTPRPPAQSPITRAVRAVVTNWHGRTLCVQSDHDLLSAYQALKPHEKQLYVHSPHAPRLLTNLTTELTRRNLLPC